MWQTFARNPPRTLFLTAPWSTFVRFILRIAPHIGQVKIYLNYFVRIFKEYFQMVDWMLFWDASYLDVISKIWIQRSGKGTEAVSCWAPHQWAMATRENKKLFFSFVSFLFQLVIPMAVLIEKNFNWKNKKKQQDFVMIKLCFRPPTVGYLFRDYCPHGKDDSPTKTIADSASD